MILLVPFLSPATLHAQAPAPVSDQSPKPGDAAVKEAGGRLVLSGETVVVTANPDAAPRDSSVATKVDTPLIETPRSVSIIDRQTLDDMGAINLTQAHDYAVGVTLLDERGPAFARGFPVDFYDLRRDGLRTYAWSIREPIAVDRVQYLRGPASVLYGDGNPGALVNMVLKKPLPVARYQFGASGGNLGFGRLTADLTGPITRDRRVRYRVVAASEWLDGGYDNDERRLTLLPTISADLGSRATVTVDTEWYRQRGRNYRRTAPATSATQRGDFSGYPWDLSINSPDYGWSGGNVSPGARLDLRLGSQSTLHIAGRYTKIDGEIDGQGLAGLTADGRSALRFQYHEISKWHEFQTDSFATAAFRTGRVEHRLVTGVEAGLSTTDSEIGIGAASALDLYDPEYPAPAEPAKRPTRYDVSRVGLYAVDQVRVTPGVIVVPALRWSRLGIENRVATSGDPRSHASVVSPGMGLVVLPRPWLSVYANYSRGFEPPAPGQYLEDGQPLEPAEHGALEGGLKADLFDRRLSVTTAVFGIRRTNIPEADPRGFFRQIAEAESRGLELEVVGGTRGLAWRGGYALTDTEIVSDTSGFAARELPNAPRHKAELWMRYRAVDGPLARVMVSSGVVHVSSRFTARDNAVAIPGYSRLDAAISYDLVGPRLTLAMFGQNLTDRRYATSGSGAVFFAGQPRRVALQLLTSF